MKSILLANIRYYTRRYIATGLTVALSMAFIVVCLVFSTGINDSITRDVKSPLVGAAATVKLDPDKVEHTLSDGEKKSTSSSQKTDRIEASFHLLKKNPSFKNVGKMSVIPIEASTPTTPSGTFALAISVSPPFGHFDFVQGDRPTDTNTIALDENSARLLKVGLHDRVRVNHVSGPNAPSAQTDFTVSGIIRSPAIPRQVVVLSAQNSLARAADSDSDSSTILLGSSNIDPSLAEQTQIAQAAQKSLNGDPSLLVETAQDTLEDELKVNSVNPGVPSALALMFPVISLVVALIVVSSSFTIVLQQRKRELALLRAIGAQARQLRSLSVLEAFVVGAASSFIGVIAGSVIGVCALVMLHSAPTFQVALSSLQPLYLVGVWMLGTLLTLFAGIRPIMKIAQVSPIEAFSPVDDDGHTQRSHRNRLYVGLFIAICGAVGMWWSLTTFVDNYARRFMCAFLCGVVCLIGALIVCSVIMIPIMMTLTRPFTRSVIPRLARANITRNPHRTGATSITVLIGVILMTMMTVGAGSMRASISADLDRRLPIDANIRLDSGMPLSAAQVEKISHVPGVDASAPVRHIPVSARIDEKDLNSAETLSLYIVPDLTNVARSSVKDIPPAHVVMSGSHMSISDQSALKVCGEHDGPCRTLTFDESSDGNAINIGLSISPATAQSLMPQGTRVDDLPADFLVVKIGERGNVDDIQEALSKISPGMQLSGNAVEKSRLTHTLNMVLNGVLGLLAVSVLVAVVGIASTLSLSVIERTRENGLLRSLGLTKNQMRTMIVEESLFLAVTTTLCGVIIGTVFGWVGVYAIPLHLAQVHLVIPWGYLGAIVLAAIVASVLAAWFPASRAARMSPIEALASVER